MDAVLYSSKKTDWETPKELYDKLHKAYNFTLDPCASVDNAKCSKYYTEKDNGLEKDWSDERVFMNPPYGNSIERWVSKASKCHAEICVGLLPARVDTRWFFDYCLYLPVGFIKGRLKFVGASYSAPFPSMLVIFYGDVPRELDGVAYWMSNIFD